MMMVKIKLRILRKNYYGIVFLAPSLASLWGFFNIKNV